MTLRVLDTDCNADAIMLGMLMCKLKMIEIALTPEDEAVLRGVLEDGTVKLICGGNTKTGAVTLQLIDSRDLPDETAVIQ